MVVVVVVGQGATDTDLAVTLDGLFLSLTATHLVPVGTAVYVLGGTLSTNAPVKALDCAECVMLDA